MQCNRFINLVRGILILLVVLYGLQAYAETGFGEWVRGLKTDARSRGIPNALLDQAFRDVKPVPRILQLDRRQAKTTITFKRYQQRTVTATRIQRGRQMLTRYRTLLQHVARQYGVQPRFIVALWGIETNYGRYTGTSNVMASLATLAYDGRRSQYFRKELLSALQIVQEGHITLSRMNGSWAGAMGQCQFMPSSFLEYAVDADGDGRKDIWNTQADVFASTANYLTQRGWQDHEIWGRQVRLPRGFDTSQATLEVQKPLQEWKRLGVRRANGWHLPQADIQGSIVLPDDQKGPAYLVYENFRVIMKWNRSQYFALSVGLLADAIGR